jgi:formylglycine-generating enzyme required for sulfatase activity
MTFSLRIPLAATLLLPGSLFATGPAWHLTLQRNSGLTITGSTGVLCAVQYKTDLSKSWHCQTFQLLHTNSYLVPNTLPTSSGSRFYRAAPLVAPSNMVFIAPATFTLGSPTNELDRFFDESPQTTVSFSSGLFIALRPVTQGEYQSVVGSNPSFFVGDLSRPVEQVSWYNATNYCALLTQRELAAGRIPAGCVYRLPTEAEWEFTCRAGTTTRFYYGDDLAYTQLTNHAWYTVNSGGQTQAVGTKPANSWGLFDMGGNVWEWCEDWYGPYPGGSVTDPWGAPTGTTRVLRGASWTDDARFCRSACRIGDDPSINFYNFYGFRVVLAPSN